MDENTAGRERVKNGTNNDNLTGIRYSDRDGNGSR